MSDTLEYANTKGPGQEQKLFCLPFQTFVKCSFSFAYLFIISAKKYSSSQWYALKAGHSTRIECHIIMRKFDFIVTHFQLQCVRFALPSRNRKNYTYAACAPNVSGNPFRSTSLKVKPEAGIQQDLLIYAERVFGGQSSAEPPLMVSGHERVPPELSV